MLKINSILFYIILATTLSGLLSMIAAAIFSWTMLSKMIEHGVSLSVGIMLSTALLHILPEAFQSLHARHHESRPLFAILLGGLLFFFLLEKLSILRHSHHYEGDGHGHSHGHDQHQAGRAGSVILIGYGLHNFTDGILIASAFLTDFRLGIMLSCANLAHDIPQKTGNFIVLLNAHFSQLRAYVYNLICSLMAVFGGLLGYFILEYSTAWIPYILVFSASSFIYIAVSDLLPQMQRRATLRETIPQCLFIMLGIALILALQVGIHQHA